MESKEEKTCETCFNGRQKMRSGHCRTMVEKPKELFCHMTGPQALKIEDDIKKYAWIHK
jgi:hypothetical protein